MSTSSLALVQRSGEAKWGPYFCSFTTRPDGIAGIKSVEKSPPVAVVNFVVRPTLSVCCHLLIRLGQGLYWLNCNFVINSQPPTLIKVATTALLLLSVEVGSK